MFIRTITILSTLSIAFFGMAIFFMYLNPPLSIDKLQEFVIEQEVEDEDFNGVLTSINQIIEEGRIFDYISPNTYTGVFLLTLGITFLVGTIHFFIDKIFFKEFYENASLFDACRRGFIFASMLIIFFYLRLKNSPQDEIYISLGILIIGEILFTIVLKEPLMGLVNKKEILDEKS